MTLKEFIIAVRSIEALNKSTKITFARIDGCYVYDDITFVAFPKSKKHVYKSLKRTSVDLNITPFASLT